ncbi:MAG: TetR family transcriptional regulator [Vulcanimicrobiaceae bacterium]
MARTADEAHRAALLDRVVDYAQEHGIAELSLRPLAQAVGASPRTLLYYFNSKDEMLAEALGQARRRQQALFASLLIAEDDSHGTVCREIWRMLSSDEARPVFRMFFEIYGIALHDRTRFPGFLERAVEEWLAFLERAPLRRGCDPRTARAIATVTLAIFRGLLLDLAATGDRERVDAAFEHWISDDAN